MTPSSRLPFGVLPLSGPQEEDVEACRVLKFPFLKFRNRSGVFLPCWFLYIIGSIEYLFLVTLDGPGEKVARKAVF